ncbi:MAG: hypothetical protein M3N54_02955 [Acidobacteriota bacterium]|nr:hypothetical protein [Acidobacteriota bacterium]
MKRPLGHSCAPSRSLVFSGTVFGLDALTGGRAVLPGKGRYQGTFLCPS